MTASPRLAALARPSPPAAVEERCELCGEALPAEHRHVADVVQRSLLCVCRFCTVLLDRDGAGGGHYRLVPERRERLDGFRLDDEQWNRLGLPVELAFFFASSVAGRTIALYPSPLGATESLLELDAWADVAAANPVLGELEPDVEALLVNRTRGARECFAVPIDECYALVAALRQQKLEPFLAELRKRCLGREVA